MLDIRPTRKLYVVGNGFDLHHGLPTGFDDFRRYVREMASGYPNHADTLETYLADLADNWSNLEQALASLDTDTLREYAGEFLVSYGADEWTDAYHHDYQYEMGRVLEALSTQLVGVFTEWIRTVPVPTPRYVHSALAIDPQARFLSFNYTDTLQKLYGVSAERITYLHGSRALDGDPIVLGHGWKPPTQTPLMQVRREDEERDPRVQEGEHLIQRYFQETQKPTAIILQKHHAYFEALADIEEVIVWGHSLSPVDLEYFKAIADATRNAPPRWLVSYFAPEDKESHAAVMQSIGVERSRLDIRPLLAFKRASYTADVVEGDLGTLWNG